MPPPRRAAALLAALVLVGVASLAFMHACGRPQPAPTPEPAPTGAQLLLRRRHLVYDKVQRVYAAAAQLDPPRLPFNFPEFELFEPPYECVAGEDRVGNIGDGGKWTCGMERVLAVQPCVVYSLGSNTQVDFEDDVYQLSNGTCEIHVFDQQDLNGFFADLPRYHFHQALVTAERGVVQFLREMHHSHLNVLKIDVEGAEFTVMDALAALPPTERPWIGELLVEVHFLDNPEDYILNAAALYKLVRNAQALGLAHFHRESNPNKPYGAQEFAFASVAPLPVALSR
eukprot:TRINITY_DN17764_c0_g1_i1.p1 TRINITY_DN17764_c0_g1~~TRINITY_DN17764_c0_g1_i1.p1  ORF type:complete len:285 (-),score=90.66 TRINITY_DN17764_c0_g1_i1:187-1041(-)